MHAHTCTYGNKQLDGTTSPIAFDKAQLAMRVLHGKISEHIIDVRNMMVIDQVGGSRSRVEQTLPTRASIAVIRH